MDRLIPVMVSLLLLWGCHGQPIATLSPASHQCDIHNVCLAWQVVPTDTGIRIEGTIINRRPRSSKPLTLTAELLDDRGNVLVDGTEQFSDDCREPKKFRVELPVSRMDLVRSVKFRYSAEREGQRYFLRQANTRP